MSELSKDTQDLLARARAVPPLARDRQIKVRAALIGQIALAPATGAAAGALGKLGFAKALVLVSAVGVVGTGAVIAARNAEAPRERDDRTAVAPRTATPANENERSAAIAPSAREAPESGRVEAPVERGPAPAPEAAQHQSRAATKKSGSSEPVTETVTPAPPAAKTDQDTLREEIDLVQQANALLRSGKPEQARALLDQHGQRFASGALREEREARILALCALGKEREAQAAAGKFLRDSPRSMQAARVRASCAKKRSTDAR